MPPGVTTTIFGAGAWGTALAVMLARAGEQVTLCVRRADQLNAFRRAHENSTYLPGIELPKNLGLTTDWRAAAPADVLVIAKNEGIGSARVAQIRIVSELECGYAPVKLV